MDTPQKSVIFGFRLEPPLTTEPWLYTLNVLILGFLSQHMFIRNHSISERLSLCAYASWSNGMSVLSGMSGSKNSIPYNNAKLVWLRLQAIVFCGSLGSLSQ